jgi:ferrochelatase
MHNPAPQPRACVFLLQLGGPKDLAGIKPFLHNLFADVLPGPMWFRNLMGKFIAWRRTPKVMPLYQALGNGSPLLPNTQAQAQALNEALIARGMPCDIQIVMRYAPPRLEEALAHAQSLGPDVPVVALPLYPHFSYATTRSSLCEMAPRLSATQGQQIRIINAYPTHPDYLSACAAQIDTVLHDVEQLATEAVHVVFSAHGLPVKLVKEGDPYPQQVEATVEALASMMPRPHPWTLAYQSRVGPVKWLQPSTSDTLKKLGAQGVKHVVVVPVSFVSEHIETLQELDVELRDEARHAGIQTYLRAQTVGTHPAFIKALADLVEQALQAAPKAFASPGACLCAPDKAPRRCLCA